jgi:hypothetical protein
MQKHAAIGMVLAAGIFLLLGGCSDSNFGEVTGTVTIDGKPCPAGIEIMFEPQIEGGSVSQGVTGEGGTYEMHYTRDQKGVMVGKSLVRLQIPMGFDPQSGQSMTDGEELGKIVIPPEFGSDSTFEVEVKSGEQVIDIPVTTSN